MRRSKVSGGGGGDVGGGRCSPPGITPTGTPGRWPRSPPPPPSRTAPPRSATRKRPHLPPLPPEEPLPPAGRGPPLPLLPVPLRRAPGRPSPGLPPSLPRAGPEGRARHGGTHPRPGRGAPKRRCASQDRYRAAEGVPRRSGWSWYSPELRRKNAQDATVRRRGANVFLG